MSTQTSQVIFPEVGDLVVATVKRVEDYGAYVKLDEFAGIEGLVHISEMATTWVRNIRDHAREGQKLVLKVLRVNPQRNQIDLSLRRVTGREKSEKLLGAKKIRRPRGSEIKIYTIGAPKYRIEVEAGSFEAAEKTLNLVTEEILDSIKKAGGEGRKIG